jgi:hypothetical protein
MSFLVTKLLGPAQETFSFGRCPAHVFRWTLFRSELFEVCLEHCDGEVASAACDYPYHFFSVGLAKAQRAKSQHTASSSCDQGSWMVLVGRQRVPVRRRAA